MKWPSKILININDIVFSFLLSHVYDGTLMSLTKRPSSYCAKMKANKYDIGKDGRPMEKRSYLLTSIRIAWVLFL